MKFEAHAIILELFLGLIHESVLFLFVEVISSWSCDDVDDDDARAHQTNYERPRTVASWQLATDKPSENLCAQHFATE